MGNAINPIGKSHNKVLDDDDQNHVDRLSDLPDGVICHILSFLPTKRSVQTSILAKRWTTLWAHVPSIDLEYYGPMGSELLQKCIATVVERNVQNLYLDLRELEVPPCLLTCTTLVKLTLRDGVSIPPTAPISLLNLKKLVLLYLEGEVDFTRLLSGCPVLEELLIDHTTCRDCCISSSTLKRLTIMYFLDRYSMFHNPDYVVTINTPALRYLKVLDRSSKHISIAPCTSLVEADITLYCCCALKFLDSISNVKCLQLKGSCGEFLDGLMPGPIAKFGNLTKLELSANWDFVSKFLESADQLQVLILRVGNWKLEPIDERCAACLLHSLRTVKITYSLCEEQVFNMVRYILGNAQVLERMEIYCPQWQGDLEEKSDAIKSFSSFHRGSAKCELDFSNHHS